MSTTTTARPPRPTAPRLPRAETTPRSRAGEVLRGLLALVVLLAVLGGVPWALVELVGNPLPTTPPTRTWLDAELSVSAVLDVLAVVLWLLWLHFAVCVTAELRAWTAGARAGDVPFGGANQVFAQRLVAAVLLLAAGAVWVPGAASALGTAPAVVTVAAITTPTAGDEGAETGAARVAAASTSEVPDAGWATGGATSDHRAGDPVSYVVHPPQGRHHDCLWDIAERTLGDPLRYHEIFELNRDRVQPDGSRLLDADLIRPGWVLLLPADAVGASSAPVAPVLAEPAAAQDGAQHRGEEVADPPDQHAATRSTPSTATTGDAPGVLSGSLLLAGVVAALRRGPQPANALADELGASADPRRAEFLDRALRQLAAAQAAAHRRPPGVRAAHLSAEELVLHLTPGPEEPAAQPPSPWTLSGAGTWRLRRTDLPAAVPAGPAALCPALVTVARSGGHEILLDLESAPGIVAVGGNVGTARDVVTAVVAELATNPRSVGLEVHLVGFGDALTALAPGRLHAHPRLGEVLQRWEATAAGPSPRNGVRVVALSGPPTEEEARRLTALVASGRPRVAALCVGDVPGAAWRFAVSGSGDLDLGVLGLRGRARPLPPAEYRRWIEGLRG